MSADQEFLRHGDNRIRGYVGDELHMEISPHGISALRPDATHTITFTGPWAVDKSVTARIFRIGSVRYLVVPAVGGTLTSNDAKAMTTTAGTVIPAIDRPAAVVHGSCIAQDGTGHVMAEVTLGTDGSIVIAPFVVVDATCISDASGTAKKFTSGAAVGNFAFVLMYETGSEVLQWQ